LEDRRNVGESSYNSGDGTDQSVQSLMLMMMMYEVNAHSRCTLIIPVIIHTVLIQNECSDAIRIVQVTRKITVQKWPVRILDAESSIVRL